MFIGEISVIIGNELKFGTHMRNISKKVTQKLGVINRISSFLDPEKEKLVFDVH